MYGLWPGVAAIVGDASMYHVECAWEVYGKKNVMAVVDSRMGYEKITDREGNPLGVVLNGSEDVSGNTCDVCLKLLDEDEQEQLDEGRIRWNGTKGKMVSVPEPAFSIGQTVQLSDEAHENDTYAHYRQGQWYLVKQWYDHEGSDTHGHPGFDTEGSGGQYCLYELMTADGRAVPNAFYGWELEAVGA